MSAFCGDRTCNARVIAYETNPHDRQVIPPCLDCLEAMTDALLGAQEDYDRERGYIR